MARKKLLYVASHLSTGGMPQYILKQVESFINSFDIQVVECANHSDVFVVQKKKIQELAIVHTLGEDKNELLDIIDREKPDIVHFTEIPEHYLSHDLLDSIFGNKDRKFTIVCSTHGSFTNPDEIKYQPDRYVLVSEWSRRKFEHLGVDTQVWEYPIEDYQYDKDEAKKEMGFEPDWKHVLMVGLFTPGKNQGEIFEVARLMEKYKIKFHFVGNQAPNFAEYWNPIMEDKPDNCIVWGERSDVDKFYKASDLFYFSSKLELNPLSIKEALSYKLPSIFRRLETYLDTYDSTELVTYIDDDIVNTRETLLSILKPEFNEIPGWFSYDKFYDDIVEKLPNNSNIVEVGTWMGKSTNYLLSRLKEGVKKVNLTVVDTFKGNGDSIQSKTLELYGGDLFTEFSDNAVMFDNYDDFNIIKDKSTHAKDSFVNNSLDFVYLDANHNYQQLIDDIDSWFYKVKPGSIIAGDDYGICSSPLTEDQHNSSYWKRVWLERHGFMPIIPNLIFTRNKEKYAVDRIDGSPNILVDDKINNVSQWSAAGGIGIHYFADKDNVDDLITALKQSYK